MPKVAKSHIVPLIICGVLAPLLSVSDANAQAGATGKELTTEQLFDSVNRSVCTIIALDERGNPASQGSGFVLRETDLLVTNAHVLAGMVSAKVRCGEQIGDVLKIVRYDQNIDLVVAEVDGLTVPGLEVSESFEIRPGAQIYAFGSPLGLEGTISPGLASGVRKIGELDYIQISAPISPGSSGGPITNATGQVIGVSVISLEGGQNLNFAVPVRYLSTLPNVELEVRVIGEQQLANHAARDEKRKTYPKTTEVEGGDELSSFRGHVFGASCPIKQRYSDPYARTSFYGGERLSKREEVLGENIGVALICDSRFGLVQGQYDLSNSDTSKFLRSLKSKYGEGQISHISRERAEELGCYSDVPSKIYAESLYSLRNPFESGEARPQEIRWALGSNLEIVAVACFSFSPNSNPPSSLDIDLVTYMNPIIWRSYIEQRLEDGLKDL